MKTELLPEEEYFINTFIVRNRRERIRFELTKTESRPHCVDRFSHNAREMLISKCIHTLESASSKAFSKQMADIAVHNQSVLIIHKNNMLDRKVEEINTALKLLEARTPYILVSCNQDFAFVETESFSETHEYLFLSDNTNASHNVYKK